MSDLALLVRLQAKVATFLAELPTDRLIALAEGRASLALLADADAGSRLAEPASVTLRPAAPTTPVEPASTQAIPSPRRGRSIPSAALVDTEAVVAQLRACESLDEATERLAALNLKAPDVKLVAKALNIPAGRTKDETARRILNLIVGARSKHTTLRKG